MPRDSAAADRPASYLVGTAAAFPLFFRDRTKPINQLPSSPSAKFPKSGSSCESRDNLAWPQRRFDMRLGVDRFVQRRKRDMARTLRSAQRELGVEGGQDDAEISGILRDAALV